MASPTMALLPLTLTLLAMTTMTTAATIPPGATAVTPLAVVALDMSPDSFDDQYGGCGRAMTAALPTLNRSEFRQDGHLAEAWALATAEWRVRTSPGSPRSPLSPAQAKALLAYTAPVSLHRTFNAAVRAAGRSRREYLDNFHFKALHFLLTDALATLRDARGQRCHRVFRGVRGVRFEVQPGRRVRDFSFFPHEEEVLIPPFEVFEVTDVTREGDKARIGLRSTGSHSNYNCEWLKEQRCGDKPCVFDAGGSVPRAPLLLLATTALAVATRTL